MSGSTIELALLPSISSAVLTDYVAVQRSAGSPLQKATIAQLVNTVGEGSTIVAGDVTITSGDAVLDTATITVLTANTLTIGGGSGTLSALTVTGALTGGTITTAGTLSAGAGTVTGLLNAGTITTAGLLTAGTVSVTGTATAAAFAGTSAAIGTLTGTTGVFSGNVTAAAAAITGAVNAATLAASGAVTAASASITGLVSGGTVASSGALTGATGSISGQATLGTLIANAGTVTLAKSTVTDAANTTLAVSGTATVGHGALTSATVGTLVANAGTVTLAKSTVTDASNTTLAVSGTAAIATLTGTVGTISTLTATTATVTEATIAGDQRKGFDFVPGWSLSWSDANGKLAGGIRKTGVLRFKAAQFDSLTVDSGGSGAARSYVPGMLTTQQDTPGYIARALNRTGLSLTRPRGANIARASRQIARPTNIHTYVPPRTNTDASVTSGTTIATLWTADFDFDWIRICLGQQANNSITASAVIAPTATANDGVNPLDESGSAQAWTTVTFNNAGSPNYEPWNQNSGATSSISMAGSTETQVWGLTYSDWMQVSSLAQTGTSTRPLVMIRVYLTGTPVAIDMSSSNMFGLTPTVYTYGRTWAGYKATGDYVSSTASYPSSGTSWGDRWAPLFIQTYSRQYGIQTWGCGDSNMAGTGSTGGFMSFLRRSVLRTNVHYPVVMGNFNQPGSSPEIYMSNVENILDAVKPSILVMFPFSFNMSATRANLDTYWARAMNIVARVNAYGGVPILVGYPPRDTATSAGDAIRALSLERLAAAAASGMRVVDPNPFVATDDDPAQWVSGMSDDNVHFNNESYGRLADLLSLEILDAIGD